MKAAAKTDPVALVEADVSERFDEGNELATKHAQQKLDLEVRQRDRLLKLASRHAAEGGGGGGRARRGGGGGGGRPGGY
jgi:hypothetical protein